MAYVHCGILLSLKLCHQYNMASPQRHCVEWHVPGLERQMLHNLCFMWNLCKPSSWDRVEGLFPRAVWGKQGHACQRVKSYSYMSTFLGIYCRVWCPQLTAMLEYYIFKICSQNGCFKHFHLKKGKHMRWHIYYLTWLWQSFRSVYQNIMLSTLNTILSIILQWRIIENKKS